MQANASAGVRVELLAVDMEDEGSLAVACQGRSVFADGDGASPPTLLSASVWNRQ